MSEPDSKTNLVISQSGALAHKSMDVLTRRGLSDLQSLEIADQWLEKANEYFVNDGKKLMSVIRRGNHELLSGSEWFRSKGHHDNMNSYFACLQHAVAASPTYPKALIEFGTAYLHGYGVGEDRNEALRLFRRASEQASTDELCDMAHEMQLTAICDPWPDGIKEAELMYRRAAERGDAGGQYSLGKMYSTGAAGLPQDYELAKYWFTKANGSDSEFPTAEDALECHWKNHRAKRKRR